LRTSLYFMLVCVCLYRSAGQSYWAALRCWWLFTLLSGWAIAGINLALNNVGLKLAARDEAIAYISVKNMFVAFFSTIAPLIGGLLADFFATHEFSGSLQFKSTNSITTFTLINLQGWNYFFIIGGLLALSIAAFP
jgi:hypothetical protein